MWSVVSQHRCEVLVEPPGAHLEFVHMDTVASTKCDLRRNTWCIYHSRASITRDHRFSHSVVSTGMNNNLFVFTGLNHTVPGTVFISCDSQPWEHDIRTNVIFLCHFSAESVKLVEMWSYQRMNDGSTLRSICNGLVMYFFLDIVHTIQ